MDAARSYRGQTAGQRRAQRRAQLLQAARETLSASGWAGTSVRAVCARAGLADRYFYESFADRDAMLAAVFDQVAEEAVVAVARALAAAPQEPRARARAAVAALVGLIDSDPGTARVVLFETPDSRVVHRHRRAAQRRFVELIVDQATTLYGAGAPDRSDRELTAHALIGALQELLTAIDEGEVEVPRERLVEHAAALAEAAALVSSGPARGEGG